MALLVRNKTLNNDGISRVFELMTAVEHLGKVSRHGSMKSTLFIIVGEAPGVTWQHVGPCIQGLVPTRKT